MGGYRDFIAHTGVKGMKWGVWNEETRARYTGRGGRSASRAKRIDKNLKKAEIAEIKGKNKKYEKRQKKAAYLKELEEPGSTSLDTKYLKGKRLKNIAGAIYGGSSVLGNLSAAATGPLAIPLYSAAWGPVAGPAVGIGLAAYNTAAAAGWTKVTMDSIKRAGSLNTTIDNRKSGQQNKQTKKQTDDRDIDPRTGEKYNKKFLNSGIKNTKAYKENDREFLKSEASRFDRDPKRYKPQDTI